MVPREELPVVRRGDRQEGPRDAAKVVFAVLRGETLSGAADARKAYTWGLSESCESEQCRPVPSLAG